jgi:hypothetical protein
VVSVTAVNEATAVRLTRDQRGAEINKKAGRSPLDVSPVGDYFGAAGASAPDLFLRDFLGALDFFALRTFFSTLGVSAAGPLGPLAACAVKVTAANSAAIAADTMVFMTPPV